MTTEEQIALYRLLDGYSEDEPMNDDPEGYNPEAILVIGVVAIVFWALLLLWWW